MTPSTEDYLETIFRLDKGEGVRVTDVANMLKVSKPSVNRALKSLTQLGFIVQEPYQNIMLTTVGKEKGRELNKKYSILRGFLIHCLGVDEVVAEQEADYMAHGMSSDTMERIGQLIQKYAVSYMK